MTGALTWACIQAAFIKAPAEATSGDAIVATEAVVTHAELQIVGTRYTLTLTLGTGITSLHIDSFLRGGQGVAPGLSVDQQCWTSVETRLGVTHGYDLALTRKPAGAPVYVGKPGAEYSYPCPADAPLAIQLNPAVASSAFEHRYLRIPGIDLKAALPAGSNRDSPILGKFLHSAIYLGPGFYDDAAHTEDVTLTDSNVGLPGSTCLVTSNVGTVAGQFDCTDDAGWGDYADTETPAIDAFLPSVTADYASPDYAPLREILLILIGAFVALAFSAILALVVPA